MRAMVLQSLGRVADDCAPLCLQDLPVPAPMTGEVLIHVSACGVCHTELDEIEGRTPPPRLPVIPGHQVVGRIAHLGAGVDGLVIGDRVGVAWIFSACGNCLYCRSGRENLCSRFQATGRDANGGYAEYICAPAAFVHTIPDDLSDIDAAPLMCAGAVGHRALELSEPANGQALGFTGFGASAHLVLQMAKYRFPDSRFYVFARDPEDRKLAQTLGAVWTGTADARPPEWLDAIIDTTPAWTPVVQAMQRLKPGGRLIINAISKEDTDRSALQQLDYARDLWMEKGIRSVANVTRKDVREALMWAAEADVRPQITVYPLEDANRALADLKAGRGRGARVLTITSVPASRA